MAPLRTIASGLGLGESVRWHEGRLWFCDWLAGEILVVDDPGAAGEPAGRPDVVGRPPVWPFSIDWLPDGRLVVVAGRQLARHEGDGRIVVHADLSDLSPYGFNEIAVSGNGWVYVNNVGFDLMSGAEPAPGLVAVIGPDGSARTVADDVWFPNGMAVTPDGSTLLVAESYGHRISAFTIERDGGLSGRRVWADLGEAAPDGIALVADGSLWYADVPHQQCRLVREGGEVLATVEVDRGCFSCAVGGPAGDTLYVAAAQWGGSEGVGAGPPTGVILATG